MTLVKSLIKFPSMRRQTWEEEFFVYAIGDVAAETLNFLPSDLRRHLNVVLVFADHTQALKYFRESANCFNSIAVFSLGVKGCGKNAIEGYEAFLVRKNDYIVSVHEYLENMRSKYGIIPSTFLKIQTTGGTGAGERLVVDRDIRDIVYTLNPKAHTIDLFSISRGDDSNPVGNSALVSLKALVEDRSSKIFTYFDRRQNRRIRTLINILSTTMVLVMLENRAGIDQKDLSDYFPATSGGVYAVNTNYTKINARNIKYLTKDDVFRLVEPTVVLDEERIYHFGLIFPPSLAEAYKISIISPVPFEDVELNSEDFIMARESLNAILKRQKTLSKNSDGERFYLPLKFKGGDTIPLMANVIMRASEEGLKYFISTLRQIVLQKSQGYLEECLDAGILDTHLLEALLNGGLEHIVKRVRS